MRITDRRFLAIFSIALFIWAVVYFPAIFGMAGIWSRSDTFAHGFFILPISLWLLWRDKENLVRCYVKPTWLPLPLLGGSLFAWLFAYVADINVLGQLSAVTSLIFLIWLLVGNQLVWRYKFPLAYLLFAVPMGENLIPWLQDVTAWFTVFFLKLNGIPVFNDGLYIQIPTGMFEVAVACSGIRYLIASMAVGTLFANLTYRKTYKQIIFIIFACLLPILANGIRAYGIVAIAYYSDMKYATGVDHIIYGWLFFGLVIMLMFWIGGLFADAETNESKPSINNTSKVLVTSSKKVAWIYVLSLLFFMITGGIIQAIPVSATPTKPSSILIGNEIIDSPWGITFNDGLSRSHVINKQGVELFKAIYANKQTRGELISFDNVLHNHRAWTVISSKEIQVNNAHAMLVHLRNMQGDPASYLYQFKVDGFRGVSENKVKLMQALQSLFRQSDYSEINAVFISGRQDNPATEQLLQTSFVQLLAEGK